MTDFNQVQQAERLVALLNDDLGSDELGVADILDDLSSLGLRLAPDEHGDSHAACVTVLGHGDMLGTPTDVALAAQLGHHLWDETRDT